MYVAGAAAPDATADESAWDNGTVLEFICYEGTMTAADGPAAGLECTDIGVAQTSSSAVGSSLGLTGTGTSKADFTWSAIDSATPGNANTGQTFGSAE